MRGCNLLLHWSTSLDPTHRTSKTPSAQKYDFILLVLLGCVRVFAHTTPVCCGGSLVADSLTFLSTFSLSSPSSLPPPLELIVLHLSATCDGNSHRQTILYVVWYLNLCIQPLNYYLFLFSLVNLTDKQLIQHNARLLHSLLLKSF